MEDTGTTYKKHAHFLGARRRWLIGMCPNTLCKTVLNYPKYAKYAEYVIYAEYIKYVEYEEYTQLEYDLVVCDRWVLCRSI
jgi:hypothetical protein